MGLKPALHMSWIFDAVNRLKLLHENKISQKWFSDFPFIQEIVSDLQKIFFKIWLPGPVANLYSYGFYSFSLQTSTLEHSAIAPSPYDQQNV